MTIESGGSIQSSACSTTNNQDRPVKKKAGLQVFWVMSKRQTAHLLKNSCLKNTLITMRNVGISLVAGVGSFPVTYIEHIAETTVWCLNDESIQDSNDDKHRFSNS